MNLCVLKDLEWKLNLIIFVSYALKQWCHGVCYSALICSKNTTLYSIKSSIA